MKHRDDEMRKVVIYRRTVLNLRKTTADDKHRMSSFVEIEQTRKRDSFYLFFSLPFSPVVVVITPVLSLLSQCISERGKNVIKMCLFSFYTINPLAASFEQI